MSGEDWRWLAAFILAAVVALAPTQCSLMKGNGWHVDIQRDTDERGRQVEDLLRPKR